MVYTHAQLKVDVNGFVHKKIASLVDYQSTLNRAVRTVLGEIDMRSMRRKATLSPDLFNGIFDYAVPSDMKAQAIIDIPGQAKRYDGHFFLVPTEEFAVKKEKGMIAVKDFNGTKVLQINSSVTDNQIIVSELDDLTNQGTWVLFGDATSVAADDADYVKGGGSIKWNISAAGGTTAGIQAPDVDPVDITDYLGGTSSFFLWVKITSTTDLTNYILRFGTDSSNYYSKTVTTRHDGSAFQAGWNLLRFSVSSLTTTGTPTDTDIKYFVMYMTKAAGKISESDYKFDWLVLKKGVVHDVEYYSKYGWQTTGGTYIENSTATTDYLNVDTDEYDAIVFKAAELAQYELKEFDEAKVYAGLYKEKKKEYQMVSPSEARIMTYEYHAY